MVKFNCKNDTIRIICIGIVSYIVGLLMLYALDSIVGDNENNIYIAGFVSVFMLVGIEKLTKCKE